MTNVLTNAKLILKPTALLVNVSTRLHRPRFFVQRIDEKFEVMVAMFVTPIAHLTPNVKCLEESLERNQAQKACLGIWVVGHKVNR